MEFNSNFNLDRIAGDSIRETGVRDNVDRLQAMFNEHSLSVSVDRDLTFLYQDLNLIFATDMFTGGTVDAELSQPYETFEHAGVKLDKRVARIKLEDLPGTFTGGNIFLLGVAGEGQRQVRSHNFSSGVVSLKNGALHFFKIVENDNYRGERGVTIDDRTVVPEILSPEEELAFTTELEKAVARTED